MSTINGLHHHLEVIELKQNQFVSYKGRNAIIIGFMRDGNICINQDGAVLYVSRRELS